MKSYVFKKGILGRCHDLIEWDAKRRKTEVFNVQDLKISISDQLAIEHNGYDFDVNEVYSILKALEENDYIEFFSSLGYEKFYYV